MLDPLLQRSRGGPRPTGNRFSDPPPAIVRIGMLPLLKYPLHRLTAMYTNVVPPSRRALELPEARIDVHLGSD
eukprot:9206953-Pyramimonas_sp.AAC.1